MSPRNISELVSEIVRQTQLIAMISKHLEKSHRTASTEEEKQNVEKQLSDVFLELKSIYKDYTS